ncbi:putative toxin-antitoxin system toxin component, PIN family [Planktothrix mougeotii]|uniref:Toxin-antitoxin system toxin component, PIN family n=1 Tax=Planktothrix mougeotii LEGE 06226 TaxID=1828728 RepID=A0ABR9UIG8_9CYAN|nr:putative toxin-antitoxin system toxin component, PIN family [Planktothrix mougeotii]MBE9146259.1 putative toxin-antitoxin system toxin component, PIN family [Planktothrix mougeotii LEGE 06226]
MNKLRIVIDTNIFISGLLLPASKAQQVFDFVTRSQILLISDSTFAEICQTLIRRKFDKYLSLEKRLNFIASLRQKAEIVNITETITTCRDPKDNKFLELAVSGQADLIITGDQDLLVLNPFRNIEIITVNEFLTRFN